MKTFALFMTSLISSHAFAVPHHRLEVRLAPAIKSLTVTDHVSSLQGHKARFRLNKSLQARVLSADDHLHVLPSSPPTPYQDYELELGPEDQDVTLQYSGVIFDPPVDIQSSGLISPEGAVLFGSSYWWPDFLTKATYEIALAQLPPNWKLASPREQIRIPQQEIFLVAGAFQEYGLQDPLSGLPLKVYLREPDPELAQTFLSLLPTYLHHYQQTLGSYPYDSFAVIENFWETGFGMPAFTLLGSGVLRLPYILNSSLPHELLHNWWGNSVYVDDQRGNWCEGLTTYLADHWQQEVLKIDREYRLQSLMNFQDYTKSAQDFPLREFKQRFNLRSQAIGYGKGMMFFHMLKMRLGKDLFQQALRNLYQQHRGQSISYEEIEKSFEQTSSSDLKSYFKQWLDRTGAPMLQLMKVRNRKVSPKTFQVQFELQQKSREDYELLVPVRFTFADGSLQNEMVKLQQSSQTFKFSFHHPPQSLEIDPEVDVFRDLDVKERPVSFSNVFGSPQIWILGTEETTKASYLQTWQKSLETKISLGDEGLLKNLPQAGTILLLGDSEEYEKLLRQELQGQDFEVNKEQITLFRTPYLKRDYRTALVVRSSARPDLIFAWIRGPALETLAPRLLHFGKYGVLVFGEKSPVLKATWPLLESPLKVKIP